MKLQAKILWKSGAAAAAILFVVLFVIGLLLNHSLQIYSGETRKHSIEVLKRNVFLLSGCDVTRLNACFASLEDKLNLLILKSSSSGGRIDSTAFPAGAEIRSAGILIQNPNGGIRCEFPSAMKISDFPEELLRFLRFTGSRNYSLVFSKKNHSMWAALAVRNPDGGARLAAFELNPAPLLGGSEWTESNSCLAFVYGEELWGSWNNLSHRNALPKELLPAMTDLGRGLPPVVNVPGTVETEEITMKTPVLFRTWELVGATLSVRTTPAQGLRLVRAMPLEPSLDEAETVHPSSYNTLFLILVLLAGFGLLLQLVANLFILRPLSDAISDAIHFVTAIAKSDFTGSKLQLGNSEEFVQLSGELNHLRDKLAGTLVRLKRSHERELQVRRESEDANRIKNALLTDLAVMMKEPLGALIGFSDLLLKKKELLGDHAGMIRKLHDQSLELNRISNRLGRLIELDSPDREPVFAGFDLLALIQQIFDAHRSSASARRLKYEMNCSRGPACDIVSDRNLLASILDLALTTLIQSAPEGATISLGFSVLGDTGQFRFGVSGSPNGKSLAEDYLAYLDAERPSVQTGEAAFFLDLVLLSSKARILGAETEIVAFENGFDTLVTVTLPFSDPPGFVPEKSMEANLVSPEEERRMRSLMTSTSIFGLERDSFVPKQRKIGILIANRSESSQTLLSMMLENEEDVELYFAKSPAECYEQLKNDRIALLLLDNNLQEPDCYECLLRIRKELRPKLLIFVLSAILTDGERSRCLQAGADLCIQKPVIPEDLLANIHKFIVREKQA